MFYIEYLLKAFTYNSEVFLSNGIFTVIHLIEMFYLDQPEKHGNGTTVPSHCSRNSFPDFSFS